LGIKNKERAGETMSLLFLVITIHFVIGALGILLLNRKLTKEKRKENWLKYTVYLLAFIVILASVLINKNAFLGATILIASLSLFELLKLSKQPGRLNSRNCFVFISIAIFSIVFFFFSVFVLLPSQIIVYTYTIVIIFDGASQISGQIAGKKKILPVLSPNKTLEGLIGGTLSATITSVILHELIGFPISRSLIFGLVICFASFVGDIAASAYKRFFGVKDFGTILPGQGGMLDRFDSFLASGAIVGLISIMTFLQADQIDRNIAAYLGFSMVFILILLSGELIQWILRLKTEYSRVFSHILAGIASLFMISLFTSHWYIIALCIQSAIFMYYSKKVELFGSHHNVERNTNGSAIFFIGLLGAYLISKITGNNSFYILSIAILAISDPVASVIGMNCKSEFWPGLSPGLKLSKTYFGSLGFFISTFIILFAGLFFFSALITRERIAFSLTISFLVTLAEAISPNGTDNLSIPLVASLALALLIR
jgi:phosphatidate cytidylyltransferase